MLLYGLQTKNLRQGYREKKADTIANYTKYALF